MNYLAHARLSFHQPEILVGNMISDFVKGRKKDGYPLLIQKGIMLHRMIDSFTDRHEATGKAKEFFRADYRLYAGAFVDIVYDHFLARDAREFADQGLACFADETYSILSGFSAWFPDSFAAIFPFMRQQNWLFNYQYTWGVQNSFKGLVRRARYLSEWEPAFEVFNRHYGELKRCYDSFFPELKATVWIQFQSLLKQNDNMK